VHGLIDVADFIFGPPGDDVAEHVELTPVEFMDIVMQLRGSNTCTVKDIVDLRKSVLQVSGETKERLDKQHEQIETLSAICQHISVQLEEQFKMSRKLDKSVKRSPGNGSQMQADEGKKIEPDVSTRSTKQPVSVCAGTLAEESTEAGDFLKTWSPAKATSDGEELASLRKTFNVLPMIAKKPPKMSKVDLSGAWRAIEASQVDYMVDTLYSVLSMLEGGSLSSHKTTCGVKTGVRGGGGGKDSLGHSTTAEESQRAGKQFEFEAQADHGDVSLIEELPPSTPTTLIEGLRPSTPTTARGSLAKTVQRPQRPRPASPASDALSMAPKTLPLSSVAMPLPEKGSI